MKKLTLILARERQRQSNITRSVYDLTELITAIDGLEIGPFRYGTSERRGKWNIIYYHSFGGSMAELESKTDITPPPWLPTEKRGWRPMLIHKQYGDPPLPELQVVRLEENIAEKIARLNRTTTARDMYDLYWIARNPSIVGNLDKTLIRRLAVLKTWVDANGLHSGNVFWRPGHEGPPFDANLWLRDRSKGDFDIDDIGALAIPVPSAKELSEEVRKSFSFLANLDVNEQTLAAVREQDRPLALRLLTELTGNKLDGKGIY